MTLLSTPATIAAQIDQINTETISFLRSQARRAYALANTEGQQQAIMDAFGINAAAAVGTYAAIYGALASLNQAADLDAPDLQIFQPQPDGTVLYISPEPIEL